MTWCYNYKEKNRKLHIIIRNKLLLLQDQFSPVKWQHRASIFNWILFWGPGEEEGEQRPPGSSQTTRQTSASPLGYSNSWGRWWVFILSNNQKHKTSFKKTHNPPGVCCHPSERSDWGGVKDLSTVSIAGEEVEFPPGAKVRRGHRHTANLNTSCEGFSFLWLA